MSLSRRPLCNHRFPKLTFVKCELEPNHAPDDHRAEGAFGKVHTWENTDTPPGRAPGQRLSTKSIRKMEDDEVWSLIRASLLEYQRRFSFGHQNFCENCGKAFKPNDLDCDHVKSRAQGGKSLPSNAQLLCNGPGSCHAKKHGEPQFGVSA